MKNYLKLVNDERQDKNVLSGKGCSRHDECSFGDYGTCTYVDVCAPDHTDCTTQYDTV